jgi:hypothetical protein
LKGKWVLAPDTNNIVVFISIHKTPNSEAGREGARAYLEEIYASETPVGIYLAMPL